MYRQSIVYDEALWKLHAHATEQNSARHKSTIPKKKIVELSLFFVDMKQLRRECVVVTVACRPTDSFNQLFIRSHTD